MAQLQLIYEENPFIRKKSREVTQFNERLSTLIDDMIETMRANDGVGLAAVQVGVLRRVVTVEVVPGEVLELVNPEIIYREGVQREREGCLSCPGQMGITERPEKVKVKAFDRHGNQVVYEGEGLKARAFCHEIDHLDGILFVDHAKMLTEEEMEEYYGD